MPSWSDIINTLRDNTGVDPTDTINNFLHNSLKKISSIRGNRNVIFYASSFLQKPYLSTTDISTTMEDIHGFLASTHGLDCNKGLVLILHTPGGEINATESIVEYLHSKFKYIETIVPTFAMSAGTMIALSTDKIIMGRPSQLGPIDPQMIVDGRSVSSRSIFNLFERAKKEIADDVINAHAWAPILASLSNGILIEAEKANKYSEDLVKKWLQNKGNTKAKEIVDYFNNPDLHKSHGKRIDIEMAKNVGVNTELLELNQELQDAVLTAYHATTIIFEKSTITKIICNNLENKWVKNISV
ncbi:MAG: SDH family Clp fold serine proteinase [Treponema sp.]